MFAASGFAEASIADVVAKAGASVGSLYHHFGGKAELYLALFEDYQSEQEGRAAAAVRRGPARARATRWSCSSSAAGPTWPAAGPSATWPGCSWPGADPAGFELLARKRYREWTRRNALLLGAETEEPWGDALVLVLTTSSARPATGLLSARTRHTSQELATHVLDLVAKIGR